MNMEAVGICENDNEFECSECDHKSPSESAIIDHIALHSYEKTKYINSTIHENNSIISDNNDTPGNSYEDILGCISIEEKSKTTEVDSEEYDYDKSQDLNNKNICLPKTENIYLANGILDGNNHGCTFSKQVNLDSVSYQDRESDDPLGVTCIWEKSPDPSLKRSNSMVEINKVNMLVNTDDYQQKRQKINQEKCLNTNQNTETVLKSENTLLEMDADNTAIYDNEGRQQKVYRKTDHIDSGKIIWYTTTQNGKPKISLNGYQYRQDGVNKNPVTQRYRCCKTGCLGKFSLHIQTNVITPTNLNHNHAEKTEGQVAAMLGQREMYKQVKNYSGADPDKIINDISATLPTCAHPHMKSTETLKRTIKAIAVKLGPKGPKNPKDLSDLLIPEKHRKTLLGEEWLFYESDLDSNNPESRMVVFGTAKMLERVSVANNLFCDGKDNKMHRLFKQFYTIHIVHYGKTFPAVFAFLPNKEQDTYTELFKVILDQIDILGFQLPCPDSIVLDFVKAPINAVVEQLPDTKIMGCFSHLTQSVYWWIHDPQRPWESDLYQNDDFRLVCKQLYGLAYLPVEDVFAVFQLVEGSCQTDEQRAVAKYFGETFVAKPSGRRHVKAPYPPETWNLNLTLYSDSPHTNNPIKGFQNKFRHLIGKQKSTVWGYIEYMKEAERMSELEMTRLTDNEEFGEESHSALSQKEKIKENLESYNTSNRLETIIAIAKILQE